MNIHEDILFMWLQPLSLLSLGMHLCLCYEPFLQLTHISLGNIIAVSVFMLYPKENILLLQIINTQCTGCDNV